MDTLESISERKNPALGNQSGYNAGQPSEAQHETRKPHSMRDNQREASEGLRGARQKKQMPHAPARSAHDDAHGPREGARGAPTGENGQRVGSDPDTATF